MAAPPTTIEPTAIPPGARRAAKAETQMLHEWVSLHGWQAQAIYELRLGPTPQTLVGVAVSPQLEAMLRVALWYADLVVPTANELLVVEAKVQPKPGAVGEALWYSTLVPTTPVLAAYAHLPVVPVVLFGESNDMLNTWARSLGVRVELYTPPWIAEYLSTRQFRNRSTPLP